MGKTESREAKFKSDAFHLSNQFFAAPSIKSNEKLAKASQV